MTCGETWVARYDTVWKSDRRGGFMKCSRCEDLTGRSVCGFNVLKKSTNNRWSIECPAGHISVRSGRYLRHMVKAERVARCAQCTAERTRNEPPKRPWKTHGKTRTPTWYKWMFMRARCRLRNYSWVCDRWNSFQNFLGDMGEVPAGRVLDRINNKDGYRPGNCRWVTPKVSTENRSNTVWLKVGGKKMRVNELAEQLHIPAARIYLRLKYGWTVKEIVDQPNSVSGFDRYGTPTVKSTTRKKVQSMAEFLEAIK